MTAFTEGSLAYTRARHPGMLDVGDLTPDRIVRRRNVGDDTRFGVACREHVVSLDAEAGVWLGECVDSPNAGLQQWYHLADYGLVTYNDGSWNQWNWVEAVEGP